MSETFLEAYKGLKNLRDDTKFKAWIMRILSIRCKRKITGLVAAKQQISLEDFVETADDVSPETADCSDRVTLRQALDEAELDVEITKAATGPQLFSVADARQMEQMKLPDADTRVPIPVEAGQTCVISGRNIKVGGEGSEIGVTLRRTDGRTGDTLFFPLSKLYPNTPTRVGFVLPADVETGSTWQVTLCTQIGSNGNKLLKTPRTVTMENTFTVGEASSTPVVPDDGKDDDDDMTEDPLT